MRILHTSDWHLGRSFGPVSLLDHQQQFIDWLVGEVAAREIDLVVIAGDVFDRAVAPTEAVVMFRESLKRLRAAGAEVAVITGNHDSADRVAAYDTLLDESGVRVRGGYGNVGEVVTIQFDDGPLDLVMLPFLDPQAAPDSLPEVDDAEQADDVSDAFGRLVRRTHESVLRAAIDAVGDLPSPRSVAIAHAFVAGGVASDSERQLTVGGTAVVPVDLFHRFSYTALGHLHRPQWVGDTRTVRYSGTPLAYSFSEEHDKSVTVVELDAVGACTVEEVPVPVGRSVRTITGTMSELLDRTDAAEIAPAFVRAVVTDTTVVRDAKVTLQQVYPHVVEIQMDAAWATADIAAPRFEGGRMSPIDAVEQFWEATTERPPSDDERSLLHGAVEHADRKAS